MRRRALFAWLGLVAVGCLAPTLPLPPPSRPDIEGPTPDGNVTLTGTAPPTTAVVAENLANGEIRGQRASAEGAYRIVIPALVGDRMALTYREGTDQSDVLFFVVPEPRSGALAPHGAPPLEEGSAYDR